MKVEVDYNVQFETGDPLPIPLGRLLVGTHVVRLVFTTSGKLLLAIPKAAVDDGSVVLLGEDL